MDFGLARLQQQDAESQSAAPAVAGTCAYMSPEQAQGERANAQSDIFSFGAVLYEMVAGQRAFIGKSAAAVLAAVLRDDPPSPAALAPRCPPALVKIIEQCLRKDPRRRFQHMGDVRLALEEVAPSRRAPRWRTAVSRRRALYAALAIVPMVVLAGRLLLKGTAQAEASSMPIPLTSFPGVEQTAAWSPDERRTGWL